MQFRTKKPHRAPSVIIVSLIDVLLVVLIFMMVSTTFKKSQSTLKVALPESTHAKTGPTDLKPFMILISSNAPYFYLDGQPITFERLQTEMQNAVKKDPQLKVTIRADKRAPLGEFIRLKDAAIDAKATDITLQTEKPAR
jgi:biopolymer transport protein ExbD